MLHTHTHTHNYQILTAKDATTQFLFSLQIVSILEAKRQGSSQPSSCDALGPPAPPTPTHPRVRASRTPLSILWPHEHVVAIRGLSRDFLAFHARAAVFLFPAHTQPSCGISEVCVSRRKNKKQKKMYDPNLAVLFQRGNLADRAWIVASSANVCGGRGFTCFITLVPNDAGGGGGFRRWRPPCSFSGPTHFDSFTLTCFHHFQPSHIKHLLSASCRFGSYVGRPMTQVSCGPRKRPSRDSCTRKPFTSTS